MKSLNDVTPRRTASGSPSRMCGSWFRMTWKPKSRTESASASSPRRPIAPRPPAAFPGPPGQGAVEEPGQAALARGVDPALGARQVRLGPERDDAAVLDRHGRLDDVGGGHDPAARDERVHRGGAHRWGSFSVTGWSTAPYCWGWRRPRKFQRVRTDA